MLQTYSAILRGNLLEWSEDMPKEIDEGAVKVYVTILSNAQTSQEEKTRGKRMADALENIAENNSLAEISDPLAWQREQREERTLPDRE